MKFMERDLRWYRSEKKRMNRKNEEKLCEKHTKNKCKNCISTQNV